MHCQENILYSRSADSNFFLQMNSKNPNEIIIMDAFH